MSISQRALSLAGPWLASLCLLTAGCKPPPTVAAPSAPPASAAPANAALTEARPVIAHLMHQMSIGAECKAGEGSLAYAPSQPDGVMAMHAPDALKNYRRPREAARQDIDKAIEAGVNTFGMLLGPNHLPSSQFASVIHAYWQMASETPGFRMSVDIWPFEKQTGLPKLSAALQLLKEKYDSTWLREDGRYVVVIKTDTHRRDAQTLTPADLDSLFAGLGGRDKVFLVLYDPEDLLKNNLEVFQYADAFTDWPHISYSQSREKVAKAVEIARQAGKDYWYPVMPAFQQSREGITGSVREKLGMVNYLEDWYRAIDANAKAVCIATWNDLTEDSAIMPESNHGEAYFRLNRLLADWYQTGTQPEITREALFVFHHPQLVAGMQLPANRLPMAAPGWSNRTPATDYVGVVAALKSPARVNLQFGETVVATHDFPAGLSAWLVYSPPANTPPEVYPKDGPRLAVTVLEQPFRDTELYLAAYRQGRRLDLFRSHRPIAEAAGRGDLSTIGDYFLLP